MAENARQATGQLRSENANTRPTKEEGYVVMFDASKRETHHPGNGFKRLFRRLRANYKVQVNKDEIALDRLCQANLVVFGGPRERFSTSEFEAIKRYVHQGGSVLFMVGEGGESNLGTNINYLLEEFGMSVNSDCVVRTVYYKYLHPKEVYIANGILNKEIARAALTGKGGAAAAESSSATKKPAGADLGNERGGLSFVYPYGATLNVQKPAISVLSSGYIAYPLNRPVGAVWEGKNAVAEERGHMCVLGSVDLFGDEWLDKEDNLKLQEVLFRWLLSDDGVRLDPIDAEDPDLNDYNRLPDTESLSLRLRSCLQESEELPKDFTQLFEDQLFKFDTNLIPEAVALYKQLNVKHEPLSLIPPQFETPLPPLQPAVFPPTLREPPPPALDQFDLDEHFASERLRLAQLTNKCSDDDLEYYIRESGEILGVTAKLGNEQRGAVFVLDYIFKQLVNFKKLNQEPMDELDGAATGGSMAGTMAQTGTNLSATAASSVAGAGEPDRSAASKMSGGNSLRPMGSNTLTAMSFDADGGAGGRPGAAEKKGAPAAAEDKLRGDKVSTDSKAADKSFK